MMNSLNPNIPSNFQNEIRVTDAAECEYLLNSSRNRKYSVVYQNSQIDSNQLIKQMHRRKLLVDLFAIFFGMGAWIGVNSVFNELPLIVSSAPEKWNLPSYLTVIIQMANVGPILYSLLKKRIKIDDKYYIYIILLIATLSALLMAFFYNRTTFIFGVEHSTALFILMFCTALVGCTSSVLFLPFMGRYLEIYLITYMLGEGLSGFVSSLVALAQGVGGTVCVNQTNPDGSTSVVPKLLPAHFTPKMYFLIECLLLLASLLSFVLLNNLKVSRSQLVEKFDKDLIKCKQINNSIEVTERSLECNEDQYEVLTKTKFRFLCYYMSLINMFGNGILPSVQSYSALPYGSSTYHYTATLSNMANPVACFLSPFVPKASRNGLTAMTVFLIISGSYLFTAALMSPTPILVGTLTGSVIIILTWVLFIGCLSYVKLSVTLICRKELSTKQNNNALFWCGAFSQIGSACGAVIIFLTINLTSIFKQYDVCQNVK